MNECSKIWLTVFPRGWHTITAKAHLTAACDHTFPTRGTNPTTDKEQFTRSNTPTARLPITLWVCSNSLSSQKVPIKQNYLLILFQLIIRKTLRYNCKANHFRFAFRFEPLEGTSPLLLERISLITSLLLANRAKNIEWRRLRLLICTYSRHLNWPYFAFY